MQWFRWDNNARHNRKLRALPVEGRWLYLSLCELASQLNLKGVVHFVPGVKLTDEQLADEAKIPVEAVPTCLKRMAAIQLIEDREDSLFVIGFAERQFQSDSSASRTKAYRERKKQERDGDVTSQKRHGDESVTPPHTHTHTHTQSHTQEPPISPKGDGATEYSSEFEEFWQAYPRTRKMSKKATYKCWSARLREGATPDRLITAAKGYAAESRRKGTGEEYIKQPQTFLGPNEHWLPFTESASPASQSPEPCEPPAGYGLSSAALLEQIRQFSARGAQQ